MKIQKEINDAASPASDREVVRETDGTYTVVQYHPVLGVVDVWQWFSTRAEAQAFSDGLTPVDPDINDVDMEILISNEFTVDQELGDVGGVAWVDPYLDEENWYEAD